MKIKVTKFGICSRCARREKCAFASTNKSSSCGSVVIGRMFKEDKEVKKDIDRIHKEEVESFFSVLRLTDRSQVTVASDFKVVYFPKSDNTRKSNSRSNSVLKFPGNDYDYIRYCENCGSRFMTVNKERRLCDDCHDEICEYLGVSYANEPKFRDNGSRRSV